MFYKSCLYNYLSLIYYYWVNIFVPGAAFWPSPQVAQDSVTRRLKHSPIIWSGNAANSEVHYDNVNAALMSPLWLTWRHSFLYHNATIPIPTLYRQLQMRIILYLIIIYMQSKSRWEEYYWPILFTCKKTKYLLDTIV